MNLIYEQVEKIKKECFYLTKLMPHDKIRIEYNRNKKINDNGKIEIINVVNISS